MTHITFSPLSRPSPGSLPRQGASFAEMIRFAREVEWLIAGIGRGSRTPVADA